LIPNATIDAYIAQMRFRLDEGERRFRQDERALHRTQAAQGSLRSGETIAKSLRLFEENFEQLTDEVLNYLQGFVQRTGLALRELLDVTSRELVNSLNAHQQVVDREKLASFAPGKSIETVIDESFARALKRLSLRVQDLQWGSQAGGSLIPAANRYVTAADNQRAELTNELEALKEEARGANDVEEEDRLIALSEIAAFEATIVQPRVSTDLIQRFVDAVLTWIQRTFTTAAVQEVAQRLIQALLKLVV